MEVPDFSSFGLVLEPTPDHEGWYRGPVIDYGTGKDLAARLRETPAARGHHFLVGALDDEGHRIYVTPPLTPSEVVLAFGVGGHGGHSVETAEREVSRRLEAIARICPFIITFADGAGLHAEFTRHLDEAAAAKIEALYADDETFQGGLEGYAQEWSGDGPLMADALVAEQGLRLWWD